MNSVSEFRVMVRDAVISQLAQDPLGFRHNDVADRIGTEFRAGGQKERKLRRQIEALCKSHLLHPCGGGIFVGGIEYVPNEAGGLEAAIYKAFYDAGGSVALPELMESLIGFDASDRVVARLLRAKSGKYFHGLPIPGWKQQWFLTEPERVRVPLPGNAQILELRMFQMRAKVTGNVNLIPLLDNFRKRIGSAIRDARLVRGRSVGEVLANRVLADRLARCLSACRSRINDPVLGELYKSVAEWWEHETQEGLDGALVTAWGYLEWDGASPAAPWLLAMLDVVCWDAVGAALGANAALLSRGVLTSSA